MRWKQLKKKIYKFQNQKLKWKKKIEPKRIYFGYDRFTLWNEISKKQIQFIKPKPNDWIHTLHIDDHEYLIVSFLVNIVSSMCELLCIFEETNSVDDVSGC